jgi:signal transduction histidine kinase
MAQLQAGMATQAAQLLEEAADAGHLEARFQLALYYTGRGRRGSQLRRQAIRHLEAILESADDDATLSTGLDRVCFVLGNIYGEESDSVEQALATFRRGLSINPLSAVGHNSLGAVLMQGPQVLGALGEFKVAIQLDPDLRAAYTNLARLLFKHVKPDDLAQEYEHIAEEFEERTPQVLARLSLELVELGREQVYEGLYTKGHQLKNLIGMVGSRVRGLLKRMDESDPATADLRSLASEHEHLYEEWVGYLSTMTPDRLTTSLIEPARLVRRVVDAVRSHTSGSRISLRIQEQGVPRVEVDERLLRDAVTNLCLNALEAVGGDKGEVVVGVGHDPEAAVVFIEVEDDGPGIASEHIEHVFDPGFTTKKQGNGYGLSIARRIVHAHRGELRVKSRVGHGSVFRLDVPVNAEVDIGPESQQRDNLLDRPN